MIKLRDKLSDQSQILFFKLINIFPKEYSNFNFPVKISKSFFENYNLIQFRTIKDTIINVEIKTMNKEIFEDNIRKVSGDLLALNYSQELVIRNLNCDSLLRQYMLALVFNKNMIYAMPWSWQKAFRSHGVKVNFILSTTAYIFDRIHFGLGCVKTYIATAIKNYKLESHVLRSDNNLVYFHWIGIENMHNNDTFREFTLTNWYSLNLLTNKLKSDIFKYDIERIPPYLNYNPKKELEILFLTISNIIKSIQIFKFRFMLYVQAFREFGNSERVKLRNNNYRHMVFNRSSSIIKPLWATTLEQLGVAVNYISYSADAEPLHANGEVNVDNIWKLSSWSKILAYDQFQVKKLKALKLSSKTDILSLGIPWWADADLELSKFNRLDRVLVIFDNAHTSKYVGDTTLNEYQIRSSINQEKFFRAIIQLAIEQKFTILHKLKRDKLKFESKQYLDLISCYKSNYSNYHLLDTTVSPIKLASVASHCIGVPFSSALFQASEYCSKVAFFDISAKLNEVDPNARGVPVISSNLSLELWLKS